MTDVKYPDVAVELTDMDGNVFHIIGAVRKAIRRKHGEAAAKEFSEEAFAQESYDGVLQLVMRTVETS